MPGGQKLNGSVVEDLCLACGLCCDGTLFADVKLQPGDDTARLQSLGLPTGAQIAGRTNSVSHSSQAPTGKLPEKCFPQPCRAFEGCRCSIYKDRPNYCREFECLLLKSVLAGKTQRRAALGIIRTAQQRADFVRRLLQELGNADAGLSLSRRFRQTAKRMEAAELDEETAEQYGKLTLAVHDLNLLLSQAFYPGDK